MQMTPAAEAILTVVPPPGFRMQNTTAEPRLETPFMGASQTAEEQLFDRFVKLGSGMSGDESCVLGDVVVMKGSDEAPFIKTVKADWLKRI
jgi:hypothetical protein